jgi:hypothetical protein
MSRRKKTKIQERGRVPECSGTPKEINVDDVSEKRPSAQQGRSVFGHGELPAQKQGFGERGGTSSGS